MALRQTKKISELPALSPASLDTTFVVGISGSTTYKISINNLTSSLDTTFATDLVTSALSNTLDTKLSTSSFNSYTASISTGSLVTSISNLNTFTASVTTASIVTSISNLNTFTASLSTASLVTSISNLNTFTASVSTASLVTSISNLNTFTASQSTSSLVNRLNIIESVSGSWITESETGSFLTSLSGAISSSSQLTSSYDTRYTLSGSVQPLPSNLLSSSAQITAFGFISSSAAIPAGTISGSAQITTLGFVSGSYLTSLSGAISSSSQLTTAFPSKTTGAWSVPAGASTQSFTVEAGASYTMWVNGNIPNGIITWNATVTTSNTNVPVVGSQYGWYYSVGNALVLTAMPDQIIGTTNTLISSPTSYAPNTSNVFKFGITNNSGTTETINYGYIKLS
jgi:hypothetical protein